MPQTVYEIVTYTVYDAVAADAARAEAEQRLRMLCGFLSWTPYRGAQTATERCDIVVWESLEDALNAADIVAAAPEFSAFRASVRNMSSMGHYCGERQERPCAAGEGVEIGRFRLRPGVSEDMARAAYLAMVHGHLATQAAWKSQKLIALDDGLFIDLAFATTRAQAEALCASWAGTPACEAFLALIEPDSMTFGTIVAAVSSP